MPKRHKSAHATTHQRRRLSRREEEEHKRRVLTQGEPSVTGSIADAVVAKNGNLFFLTDHAGIVPLMGDHGFGLYYNDCRYLSGHDLKLAGAHPLCLVSTAERGYLAAFQLTNPDIRMSGGALIRKEGIGVRWERLVNADKPALDELITLENYEAQDVAFPITLTFEAGFEDVFAIRGLLPEKLGRSHKPEWKDGALSFVYEGANGFYRSLSVNFSPAPDLTEGTAARFDLRLRPGERKRLAVSLVIAESENVNESSPDPHYHSDFRRVEGKLRRECDEWVAGGTEVRSESLLLGAVMDRSLRDLYALKSRLGEQEYFAAGVPWFVTLFGRGSLITALQTLAYDPEIAAQTLRLLAKYQSRRMDEWRDAQPGKILHELRTGEMAKLGEIPHTPYYGTIDATPLFLILVGRHAAWTGDVRLFNELRDNVEMALEWIGKYGDLDGDGFIEYATASEKGLINQGWKDSGDAIVNADGSLGRPPIALVEAQGYAYQAKREIASLFRRAGDDGRAERLESEADELRRRFNQDFWLEGKGIYALALQAGQEPVAVVSSNPGHALWSGIADEDKARRTMERLMADDVFNGWGVRPQLPDFVYWLEARKLRVGSAYADLRFERAADGTTAFRVMRIDGRLDVVGDGSVL